MNTWPNETRHAMSQDDHNVWNARNYPGTLQICVDCDEPTDRCDILRKGQDYGNKGFSCARF